jgi:hypothetical protein
MNRRVVVEMFKEPLRLQSERDDYQAWLKQTPAIMEWARTNPSSPQRDQVILDVQSTMVHVFDQALGYGQQKDIAYLTQETKNKLLQIWCPVFRGPFISPGVPLPLLSKSIDSSFARTSLR